MPQLGETVTEGTITRWFKQVGERVEVDEPLFEVSTDKVDSEVPAPEAGVITEIVVQEGETVPVGARDTCERLGRFVDKVICLIAPEPFQAVGLWYDEFSQTSDDEVKRLLTNTELSQPTTSLLHHNVDEA